MRGTGGGSRLFRAKARPHFFADLDLSSILQPADPKEGSFVASKVVVTLGPACRDVDTLSSLLEAGMTVARVDLTWGPLPYHKQSLRNLNEAMKRVRRMCAVMVDTLGREMLIRRSFKLDSDGWPQHDTPYKVSAGSCVTITTREGPIGPTELPITYPKFPSLVLPDDIVYIGRYMACGAPEMASLYLRVVQVHPDQGDVVCTALNDAELHGLLTVFNLERSASELVGLQSDLPVLSEYDKVSMRDLAAEGFEVDFVCVSYTRSGADVREVRTFVEGVPELAAAGVVAKVETRQALFNFRGILEAADGIVISRGLLGLDCVPEKVTLVQKSLISACNLVGKPVLVTRVLDTMTDNPRPTRAEATDVANAVLDGADAMLLGAETLRGKYPVATVRTAVSICRQAEKVFDFKHHFEWLMQAAMDAQEMRDMLAASGGPGGGSMYDSRMGGFAGADLDDDSRTDILTYTPGIGAGFGGGGTLSTANSVGGLGGLGGYGGYGHFSSSVAGGLAGLAGGGVNGLSPASTATANLEDLNLDAAAAPLPGGGGSGSSGGGGAGGGPGHHVSFATLPPRPPNRTRSDASMPDIAPAGPGPAGGAVAGVPGASGTVSPLTQTPGGSRSQSYADINTAVAAMAQFGNGPAPSAGHPRSHHHHHHGSSHHAHSHPGHGPASGRASPSARSTAGTVYGGGPVGPWMGKLESIASSAVRAAEKVQARLIVVYTHTSRVAALVAKYRPPMPILTLVVPRLLSDGLKWRLEGRGHARQCLMVRGLLPMLSAPGPSGDEVLEEAIATASKLGLVGPGHHVVCVERVHDAFCVKIVAVDELGLGIDRPDGVDPTAAVVRAMVPATPVVGRTLSMMNDRSLPSAAALRAAAAAATGAHRTSFGGNASGIGAITSLLAQTPSTFNAGISPGKAFGGAASSGGSGGGGFPRRQTSQELIDNVLASPFAGSPPVGVGLQYGSGGGGAKLGLLHSLLAAAGEGSSDGGSGGGGGRHASPPAAPSTGAGIGGLGSLTGGTVVNAVGGGPAARDGLAGMTAEGAADGGGGIVPGALGMVPGVRELGVATRSLLGAVTEEPEPEVDATAVLEVQREEKGGGGGEAAARAREEKGGSMAAV